MSNSPKDVAYRAGVIRGTGVGREFERERIVKILEAWLADDDGDFDEAMLKVRSGWSPKSFLGESWTSRVALDDLRKLAEAMGEYDNLNNPLIEGETK